MRRTTKRDGTQNIHRGGNMRTCSSCKGQIEALNGKTPEGVSYEYYRCQKCGQEILDMQQLHKVAANYRTIRNYHTKISQWGMSLGIRIPKELVEKYGLKKEKELTLVAEEDGIRLVV